MLDRKPIALIMAANGTWNHPKRPEMNAYGYAPRLRVADPVGVLLAEIEQNLARGFHVAVKGLIGTGPGQDVTGAYPAMFPQIKSEWEARFPFNRQQWKTRYPGLRVGHYTGSKWGSQGPTSLKCEGDVLVGTYTCDTRTDQAQANFNVANGAYIRQGADLLIFDKGTHETRLEGTREAAKYCASLDAIGLPEVAVISEAIRDGADELPMMARTHFIREQGLWDKKWPDESRRYWLMQVEDGVPTSGPDAESFIKRICDNGWIPMVQVPLLAAETIQVAATHPRLTWG